MRQLKIFTSLIVLGACMNIMGQDDPTNGSKFENVQNMIFTESPNCAEAEKYALDDLKASNPILLLAGGIAPVVITTDADFEKKYDLTFHDYGCIQPSQICMETYNAIIFEFLTEKYGRKWLKEVRKDVIGLKKWIKNAI